jgi:hypothetical protein
VHVNWLDLANIYTFQNTMRYMIHIYIHVYIDKKINNNKKNYTG